MTASAPLRLSRPLAVIMWDFSWLERRWPGAGYETSTPERIRRFSEIVFEGGFSAPVRTPRGRDIDAACGQLKTAAEKKSRAQRDREAAAAAAAQDA